MSLYQVGDVVRVKTGFTSCDSSFVSDMANFYGEEVTIEREYNGRYIIAEDPDKWYWSDDCFEGLVTPEDESAVSLEGLL